MSIFQGRTCQRYFGLTIFVALLFLFYQAFASGPKVPVYTSSAEIPYVPSKTDWSQQRIFFPVQKLKLPPSGAPKKLPSVQARRQPRAKDDVVEQRKEEIRAKFLKTWDAYKRYAWPKDELMPLSAKGRHTLSGWGAQIVDGLDTLWIMGLEDDFRSALGHVASIDFSVHTDASINVFEVTIRYLGGLISAYDLSHEPILLSKATELGDALYSAFDTPNRLPVSWLSYRDMRKGRQEGSLATISAMGGSLAMEFTRLSQLTGDPRYYDATERVKELLYETQNITKVPGLWPRILNFRDGNADQSMFSLGAGADSLYEYLPKMHALIGGLDPQYADMTVRALEVAHEKLLFRPMNPNDDDILLSGGMVYMHGDVSRAYEMQHLTCFAGGMYGLAGKLLSRPDFVSIGHRLTQGCVWAYDSFPTGIMPEIAQLVPCASLTGPCPLPKNQALRTTRSRDKVPLPEAFVRVRDPRYTMRPEAIESVFYMWRITGDEIWRDAAWRMWQAIVKETETDLAFAAVDDVRVVGSPKSDSLDTFWISETLKYFYLIFDDESTLNLDEWVFNTEAHPFRRP